MDISVEKTPKQKLSQYAVDTASSVSVTHLPGTDLSVVKDAAIALNDQAGSAKAVAHIGARNLQTESELHENCIAMRKAGVDKVLLIGGSTYDGKVYQTFYEVKEAIQDYGFDMYCGVYPQSEQYSMMQYTIYILKVVCFVFLVRKHSISGKRKHVMVYQQIAHSKVYTSMQNYVDC